uniref:Integrase catalytic domain-containing protein n=1 Tax=Trichogramma kaykai TaxID=54128 RepID=A0ABD2WYY7_9HYME
MSSKVSFSGSNDYLSVLGLIKIQLVLIFDEAKDDFNPRSGYGPNTSDGEKSEKAISEESDQDVISEQSDTEEMADGDSKHDEYTRISVRKLKSEEQWETWKWQIELCPKEQCLFSIIDGSRTCPTAPIGTAAPSKEYKVWQDDNAKAARIIGTALEEDAAMFVRKKVDAKDIWDTLVSVYEQSSLQRLYTLFDIFFGILKDEATSIKKHATQLANVFSDILDESRKSDTNAKLPLSLLHHRIFKTLGSEYQFYRSTWYTYAEKDQTTNLLVENLVSIESSLSTQSSQISTAFHAKSKFVSKNKSVNKPTANSEKKQKRTCHYCKKVGHLISICLKRLEAESKNTENQSSEVSSKNYANKHSTFLATSFSVGSDSMPVDVWISDSGATHHMTANRQHFSSYEPFPIPQPVEIANNSCIHAHGCGNIDIEVLVGGKWSSAQLKNVRYVPDVGNQLFSVRQATAHGNKIIQVRVKDTKSFCDGCVLGKSHRKPFHPRQKRSQQVGELINSDVNGPMSTSSINGFRYYVVFKDDFSKYTRIFFMKEKSEVASHLSTFQNECHTNDHIVKYFRSDGGGEFDCSNVRKLLAARGIEFQLTCPHTPEQNGVSEQSNRHVVELARSMLAVSEMSKGFWAHACETAAFLINRTGKSSVANKSPIELWSGKSFKSFNHLKIFGSECYVNIPKQFRRKFDKKAVFGRFVGYVNEKDGYQVWVPSKNRVINSRNVDFRPEKLCTNHNEVELLINSEKDEEVSSSENCDPEEEESSCEEFHDTMNDAQDVKINAKEAASVHERGEASKFNSNARPSRKIQPPARLNDYEVSYQTHRLPNRQENSAWALLTEAIKQDNKPTNFQEAIKGHYREEWIRAMDEEMKAFDENETWELVHLPLNKHVIDNRWVLRIKYKPDGTIDQFRARLVARGIFQRAEVDYEETFSPDARYDSIRALIATAANEKLVLGQFDIRSAFLYESRKLIVAIYVDDGLIPGSSQAEVDIFLEELKSEFKITNGSLESFLGMSVQRRESGFFINQRIYTEKILQRFGMINCNPAKTPVESYASDQGESCALDKKIPYRSTIGSLMYVAYETRPDIVYAVSRAARSMTQPTTLDCTAVKRIFRYLKGTMDVGLLYQSSTKGLCAYSDADFAGDISTRRSTNGFVSLIGDTAVSWTSQLQKSVALSTTEAKFVAASEGAKELVWLDRLLSEIHPN